MGLAPDTITAGRQIGKISLSIVLGTLLKHAYTGLCECGLSVFGVPRLDRGQHAVTDRTKPLLVLLNPNELTRTDKVQANKSPHLLKLA
jgi:hypothetical protein